MKPIKENPYLTQGHLNIPISGGDSDLSTTFCDDHVVYTTFLFHDSFWHHNANDVYCDIITDHGDTYEVLVHILIYYYTQCSVP